MAPDEAVGPGDQHRLHGKSPCALPAAAAGIFIRGALRISISRYPVSSGSAAPMASLKSAAAVHWPDSGSNRLVTRAGLPTRRLNGGADFVTSKPEPTTQP